MKGLRNTRLWETTLVTLMLGMLTGCITFKRDDPSSVGTFYPNKPIQGVYLTKDSWDNKKNIISFSKPAEIKAVGKMTWNSLIGDYYEVALISPKLDHLPGDYWISTNGDYYATISWLHANGRIEYTGYKTSANYFWESVARYMTSPLSIILVLIVLVYFSYIKLRKPNSYKNNYAGYSSHSYSPTSYSSYSTGGSSTGNHNNIKDNIVVEKEKRIIGHAGSGNRINPKTGVFQKEEWFGYTETNKRIEPETGKNQKEGWFGWEDTGTRVDQESGKIQKEGWLGLEDTGTRVNPETGIIQKEGWLGWEDTDKRIDPKTGRSQHNGWFGWEDD